MSTLETFISRGNNLPSDRPLSLLQVGRNPQTTTERYRETDDRQVVEILNDHGWFISKYEQRNARNGNAIYAPYLATYTNPKFKNDREGSLTLLQSNSKDGKKSFQFSLGFYRFVCSNGLVVGEHVLPPIRIRHKGSLPENMAEVISRVAGDSTEVFDRIEGLKKATLSTVEAIEFAKQASELRFEPDQVDPRDLLRVRRSEDRQDTVWHTFNIVQENIMKADKSYTMRTKTNKVRAVSSVKDIDKVLSINAELWNLAEKFANG